MAQIADDDSIYNLIDQLQEQGKYEQILEKISEISEGQISNKLWFEKIRALNSLGRFKEARKEISLLSKHCSEPKEDARLYCLLGYTFEHTGCRLKAVECYRRTQEFDPEYDNIRDMIDNCLESVKQEMEKTKEAFGKLFADVDLAISKAKGRKKIEYPETLAYVSLIESSFLSTNMGWELSLDAPLFRCKDEKVKEKIKQYLAHEYGVTDIKSLQQWYGNSRIAPTIQGVRDAIAKNIRMPVEKMNAKEIVYFESIMMSLNYLEKLLPKAGVAAWDYNVVTTLARLAYAAGLITNTDFCETTMFFTEECKRSFSSWEEFTHSVILGGYFNILAQSQYDIESATAFGTIAGKHCKEAYSQVKWMK